MLPCHNPLPTMCHNGLHESSSLGQSIIISHITVLDGLLNGLYTTCNTRSLFMELTVVFTSRANCPLNANNQQPPFSQKHPWLSVPCHCQPVLCKLIYHVTLRLIADNDSRRQLLLRHTPAIYNQ